MSRNVAEDNRSDIEDECKDCVALEGDLAEVGDDTDLGQNDIVEENLGSALSGECDVDSIGQCSPDSQLILTPIPLSGPTSISSTAQQFTLDGPVTRIGWKWRARNLQAILEVCTCGQPVTQEEISGDQNVIKCTSMGCETQWVSCELVNRTHGTDAASSTIYRRSCLCPTFSERNQSEPLGFWVEILEHSTTQIVGNLSNLSDWIPIGKVNSDRTTQNYFRPVSDRKDSQKSDKW